jgi:hypothetical protein
LLLKGDGQEQGNERVLMTPPHVHAQV